MVKARIIKLTDTIGDILLINLDDISYIKQDLNKLSIKFKNSMEEYKFTDLSEESIKELIKLL